MVKEQRWHLNKKKILKETSGNNYIIFHNNNHVTVQFSYKGDSKEPRSAKREREREREREKTSINETRKTNGVVKNSNWINNFQVIANNLYLDLIFFTENLLFSYLWEYNKDWVGTLSVMAIVTGNGICDISFIPRRSCFSFYDYTLGMSTNPLDRQPARSKYNKRLD